MTISGPSAGQRFGSTSRRTRYNAEKTQRRRRQDNRVVGVTRMAKRGGGIRQRLRAAGLSGGVDTAPCDSTLASLLLRQWARTRAGHSRGRSSRLARRVRARAGGAGESSPAWQPGTSPKQPAAQQHPRHYTCTIYRETVCIRYSVRYRDLQRVLPPAKLTVELTSLQLLQSNSLAVIWPHEPWLARADRTTCV